MSSTPSRPMTRTRAVALLRRAPLPLKATTAMRLADDPLEDEWVRQPNPMEGTG